MLTKTTEPAAVMKSLYRFSSVVQMSVLIVVMALGFTVRAASAADCMQTVYNLFNGTQSLTCTSNDVRIARVTDITDVNGNLLTSCTAGDTITFDANFHVELTAQARYDIGLYLATDGDPNLDGALTGSCFDGIITTANAPVSFINLDASPDICGDIDADHNPQIVHLRVTTPCVAGANSLLKLPNCTSWRQPGSNELCDEVADAFPGSPSKCNCDKNFTIPVTVQRPNITVTKTPNPTQVNEPGGSVDFTVRVTNPATVVSVTLTELTEDFTNNGSVDMTYLSSSTPSLSTICGDNLLLSPGEYTDCTFTRTVSGDAGDQVTDRVCVSGTDSNTPPLPVGPTCANANVTVVGVPPSAAPKKIPTKAVMTFEVQVKNTSTAEQVFLGAICDNIYGTIASSGSLTCTAATLSIISTTCGTATPGTLPATLAINGNTGDTYTCTFNAEVPIDGNPHTDTVTAKVSDNDGNTITTGGANATVTVTTSHTP